MKSLQLRRCKQIAEPRKYCLVRVIVFLWRVFSLFFLFLTGWEFDLIPYTNHFDINTLSGSLNAICVADLGCSIGPNTFVSVQNIIEAIELKYISKGENIETPKFMVFFNDQLSNDFNTLFISLPPNRQYFAAGVMGSFYGHLFPKASLHFIHSSYAQQWLSNVPKKLWMNGQLLGIKEGFSTQMHQRKLRCNSICQGHGVLPNCYSTRACDWRATSTFHSCCP